MKKKRKVGKYVFQYICFVLLIVLLIFGLNSCAKQNEEIRVEKAGEFISKCENPYAFWQGVNGKSCDDARRTYYKYTEEEWKQEKRKLIEFGDITEDDYLYSEIKKEIMKEGKK
ncbi:hypothetical protein ACFVP8_03890 [Viridibacillus arvi]|uniref:hypothetical protein n=1 Tax=Viridibacillus arvi TaxID=263475 RepID=UPI0036BCAD38